MPRGSEHLQKTCTRNHRFITNSASHGYALYDYFDLGGFDQKVP
jgi:hypothetical protein